MKRVFYFIVLLLTVALIISCGGNSTEGAPTNKKNIGMASPISLSDTTWKALTLRQKIGQLMLVLPDHQKELKLGDGSLVTFFKRYPVSGFFMGWKLWDGIKPDEYLDHIKKACFEYQQASELPLIFQEDYESGVSLPGMTSFPNEMALGAANSPELAYQYGKFVAMESKSVGVRWVLHPVADLNMNPFNPVTNTRSISDDPDKAIRLLSQQIKGLQDNGVAATVKHFPGDGVDFRDQHLLTSCNSLPFDVWKKYHGKVFKALIDSGVMAIMPGHISLPSYQKERVNGHCLPATLSKELLTNLLKNELGFKGVVVSDAMVMGGFRGWYDDQLEGEIHSFLAGVDVLLWPSYQFMDTLEARILRKEIPIERLNDAVSRVWNFKKRLGLLDKNRQLIDSVPFSEKQHAKSISDQICERAITLIRDRNHSLPLNSKKDRKILVVGVTPVSRKGGDVSLMNIKAFSDALREEGFAVDFQHDILYETQGWTESLTKRYDRILVIIDRHMHAPYGPLEFWDDEAQTVWGINAMPKEKIVVISVGSPYLINEYFERVNTCINAYSNARVMQTALIKVLTGRIKMRGISPVNLDIQSKFKLY
ncbi:MAG: glycoside hydrolase family 3 protein [Bacteroides sp.]|jgi:beta-N-acetylhexosaminidase|nr:glycoside hydrolase family 3 protein [Bacteroides sp.]MCI1681330.1 glycoside hydrolase family 3 protein [Bacteroides sp.]